MSSNNTSSLLPPPPPILRNEDGSGSSAEEFICPLCCEIPMDPVVTPCQHVFCRSCIHRALEIRRECPNDRQPLRRRDLRPVSGIAKRVWERIPVNCPSSDCEWTGTVGNFAAHFHRCRESGVSSETVQRYEDMLKEKDRLIDEKKGKLREQEAEIQRLSAQKEEIIARILRLGQKVGELAITTAEWQNNQDVPFKLFDATYGYNRFNVVDLAQLVCRNLDRTKKPKGVNMNRLFNCIKNCYEDLQRARPDNPKNYRQNVRMLLNVCRVSRVFTEKQQANFEQWCSNEGW